MTMKRTLTALAALGLLAVAVPAAAQSWAPINARQVMLDARIDQGVRNGRLTAPEAMNLRTEFRGLADMEARYRATGGLQSWEQADLDRRFDVLQAKINVEVNDRQTANNGPRNPLPANWTSPIQHQDDFNRRIDLGLRNRTLTVQEAAGLRAEFKTLASMEQRYRANGLDNVERQDLDRRYDVLNARIRVETADQQTAPNWQAINARQANLDYRIDQGVRNGKLTRNEAINLRGQFQAIARQEAAYRASGGLQGWERADLDTRFDRLSAMINQQINDRQYGGGYR